jgi:hypothetical protein
MPLLIERLCANDQALQTHLDAIKESESLIAIVLAAWQLGLAIATLVVEQELAIRAQQPTQCQSLWLEALRQGLRQANQVAWLSDGGRGFWSLYQDCFANYAIGILDFYHLKHEVLVRPI